MVSPVLAKWGLIITIFLLPFETTASIMNVCFADAVRRAIDGSIGIHTMMPGERGRPVPIHVDEASYPIWEE